MFDVASVGFYKVGQRLNRAKKELKGDFGKLKKELAEDGGLHEKQQERYMAIARNKNIELNYSKLPPQWTFWEKLSSLTDAQFNAVAHLINKDAKWKELLEIFKLKDIHSQTKEYQQKIIESESVSLHIRRGDYINHPFLNTCDVEYYKKAVMEILKINKQVHFFIFSDDIHWVKNNLDFINHKTLIVLESDIPDNEEMYLMSQCKYNIIANSSFSWWGAWLNQNSDKKVIAPKKWFKSSTLNTNDLIPASWVRL